MSYKLMSEIVTQILVVVVIVILVAFSESLCCIIVVVVVVVAIVVVVALFPIVHNYTYFGVAGCTRWLVLANQSLTPLLNWIGCSRLLPLQLLAKRIYNVLAL